MEQIRSGERRGGKELVINTFVRRQSCGLLVEASTEAVGWSTFDDPAIVLGVNFDITSDLISARFSRMAPIIKLLMSRVEWASIAGGKMQWRSQRY